MGEIIRAHLRLVSLDPDAAVQGGLPLSNVNVEVVKSRFTMFDYQGKRESDTIALHWNMKGLVAGEEYDQWWSVGGKLGDFEIIEDGKELSIISGNIRKGCKFHMLMSSLRTSGFPQDKLAVSDVSMFEGMQVHMITVPDIDRPGLDLKEGRVVPVVDKVLRYPWDAPKGKSKAAGKKADAEPAQDVDNLAVATVMAILGDAGPTSRTDLGSEVFKRLDKHPLASKVVSKVYTPSFLEGVKGLKVKEGIVSFDVEE